MKTRLEDENVTEVLEQASKILEEEKASLNMRAGAGRGRNLFRKKVHAVILYLCILWISDTNANTNTYTDTHTNINALSYFTRLEWWPIVYRWPQEAPK